LSAIILSGSAKKKLVFSSRSAKLVADSVNDPNLSENRRRKKSGRESGEGRSKEEEQKTYHHQGMPNA
jgi:hypothetical protein